MIASLEVALLVASALPNRWATTAAEREDPRGARRWLLVTTALGAAFVALRFLLFSRIAFRWDNHAYGSVVWTTLGLNATHALSGVLENVFLLVLLFRGPVEKKHFVDVELSSILWNFVVGSWVPVFVIFYPAHMSQHEALMLIAAPLVVLGRPLVPFLWALPPDRHERVGRWAQRPRVLAVWRAITHPFWVLVMHGVVLWVWHVPALFEAALGDSAIHAVQHFLFFLTAALFWWAMIHGRYGRIGYGVAVLYVFATAMHTSLLGALLTVARSLWYPMYGPRTSAWGLSPLEDQELAGIIMWVPAGVVFILFGLSLFAAWMGQAERRVARSQGRAPW